jgi:hypothetical protein
MKAQQLGFNPNQGDFVILNSDFWIIFDQGFWRPMTVDEQLLASI